MDSPRRVPVITLIVTSVLVFGIVVAVIALLATHAPSGTTPTRTSDNVCHQRLTWVSADTNTTLLSVTALSRQNAWAAGVQGRNAAMMHWDGGHWNEVNLPAIAAASSALNAISAVNAQDIWAVGRADLQPLILHWNGKAWSQVDVAPTTSYSGQFSALAVIATDDVWAVGSALAAPSDKPHIIAQHWDGHTWRVAPAPQGNSFTALAANGARNVWGLITAPDDTTQLVHWDGRMWQEQLVTDSSKPQLDLRTIAVGGDGAVWVAGSYWPAGVNWAEPIVERWDGSSWSVVSRPALEARGAWFTSLAIATDGTVWAGGTFRNISTRLNEAMLAREGGQKSVLSLYPSRYNDPHNGDAFSVTGVAVVPGTNMAWVIGGTGSVPNPYHPPIDSNLPVASGGFILSYC